MVETDSPYLAPVPHRGAVNRPAWVPLVGQFIADLHDVPVAEVATATSTTAQRFFALAG
jgi:TatD DNase family protein